MKIRQATFEDLKPIKEIADLLYIEMPGFVWNNEEFIRKQIERGEYYVTENPPAGGGKIVGIMSLRERNKMIYIETLAVAKDIQTKGVGSKMVDFAKIFSKENNFKIMRTTSFYEYGVKDFYLKHGFRLLDEPGEYSGHKFHRLEFD